jgi:hypothetical protein
MSDNSRLVELADALATALNAAQPAPADPDADPPVETEPSPFILPFAAESTALPVVDYKQIGTTLLVYVVPIGFDQERVGGGASPVFSGRAEIDFLVEQKVGVGTDAQTAVKKLLLLQEQMVNLFKNCAVILTGGKAVLAEVSASPTYSQAALLTRNCFCGVQTLTFVLFA